MITNIMKKNLIFDWFVKKCVLNLYIKWEAVDSVETWLFYFGPINTSYILGYRLTTEMDIEDTIYQ